MDSLKISDNYAAKGATAPRVTLQSMEDKIAAEAYFTAGDAGDALNIPMHSAARLLTLCVLTMHNGFTIIGKSAPASPENFDVEKGRHFAREDAIKQLWPLEGYALREKLSMIEDLKGAIPAALGMKSEPEITGKEFQGHNQEIGEPVVTGREYDPETLPFQGEPVRKWKTDKDGYENGN